MNYRVEIAPSQVRRDAWYWAVSVERLPRIQGGYTWTKWGAKRRVMRAIREHKRVLARKAQAESYTIKGEDV